MGYSKKDSKIKAQFFFWTRPHRVLGGFLFDLRVSALPNFGLPVGIASSISIIEG
jgi:hypothetical protein